MDESPTPGTLPDNYEAVLSWKLAQNKRQVNILQIASVILFFVFAFVFFWLAAVWGRMPSELEIRLPVLGVALLGLVATLLLHELAHGLAMKFFGAKPEYGALWKKAMFYATSPGFAYSRNQYLVVLLTPLAALTALFVLGIGLLSGTNWVVLFAFCAALNASGAIGDMWMTALALRYPRAAYVVDKRDGMEIFLPQPGSRLQ